MRIRKTAVLLVLSLMMTGGFAGAQDLSRADGNGTLGEMSALAPVFPGVGPVMGSSTAPLADTIQKAGAVPVSEMGDSFLNHVSLPKHMQYESLAKETPSLPATWAP